jgi:hypothetical protein
MAGRCAVKNPFWDDYLDMLSVFGIICCIVAVLAAIFGGIFLGYYFTGYQADLANCRAAGGHYVGGPLGDCVYPGGDTTRVHVNGTR